MTSNQKSNKFSYNKKLTSDSFKTHYELQEENYINSVRDAMQRLNISQRELSRRINVSQTNLSKLLRGKLPVISKQLEIGIYQELKVHRFNNVEESDDESLDKLSPEMNQLIRMLEASDTKLSAEQINLITAKVTLDLTTYVPDLPSVLFNSIQPIEDQMQNRYGYTWYMARLETYLFELLQKSNVGFSKTVENGTLYTIGWTRFGVTRTGTGNQSIHYRHRNSGSETYSQGIVPFFNFINQSVLPHGDPQKGVNLDLHRINTTRNLAEIDSDDVRYLIFYTKKLRDKEIHCYIQNRVPYTSAQKNWFIKNIDKYINYVEKDQNWRR
jgi:transcriptional regulator with XRE-family HTH domain